MHDSVGTFEPCFTLLPFGGRFTGTIHAIPPPTNHKIALLEGSVKRRRESARPLLAVWAPPLSQPLRRLLRGEEGKLFGDDLSHRAHPFVVRKGTLLFLAIKKLLAVQIYLNTTLTRRGNSDGQVLAKLVPELCRHPGGQAQVPSRYAVNDLELSLTFHLFPPVSAL